MPNGTHSKGILRFVFRAIGNFVVERTEFVFAVTAGDGGLIVGWKSKNFGKRVSVNCVRHKLQYFLRLQALDCPWAAAGIKKAVVEAAGAALPKFERSGLEP